MRRNVMIHENSSITFDENEREKWSYSVHNMYLKDTGGYIKAYNIRSPENLQNETEIVCCFKIRCIEVEFLS